MAGEWGALHRALCKPPKSVKVVQRHAALMAFEGPGGRGAVARTVRKLPGGNVCPALTIPTSAPDLPSHGEAPQVDHVALHTFPTKHVA